MNIRCRIFPISINLSKENYISIIRVLNSNILYDDLLDKYLIEAYEKKS
jgi:hypothetical protein